MKQSHFRGIRRAYDLLSIKTSRFFNAGWYLYRYPDVRDAALDPARHYLDFGAQEGRDPSWAFSTAGYLLRYPDVAASGENPLLHFIRIGAREGREPDRDFLVEIKPPLDYRPEVDVAAAFDRLLRERRPARVLEAGTRQSTPGVATHSRPNFPWVRDADYLKMDIREGQDVDVVADLHALPAQWTSAFDCFLANAVFEHLERPWIAAKEIARVLAPGGLFWIGTHQCFPIHGHPNDFFRFSRDALRLLLEDAGLIVEASDYEGRCAILPPGDMVFPANVDLWNMTEPSFIAVRAAGRKPA